MIYDSKRNMYAEYIVGADAPLLEWLLANLKGMSRNKIKDILQGHGIKVNGKTVTQYDYPLLKGQRVSVSKSKKNDTFKSRYVNLVYEDQYLVVIEKKPGILSMAAGHKSLNVKSVLDDYFRRTRQRCTAHVVHRLDRDTSGLMLFAKSREAKDAMQHNWNNMVLHRTYVAVVEGKVEEEQGVVKSYLGETSQYEVYSSQDPSAGQLAVTRYRRLATANGYSLMELELDTGRKNQIRVHMKDLGHSIVGDRKYGAKSSPIHRLALHARTLDFVHPMTRQELKFETPIPARFTALLTVGGK